MQVANSRSKIVVCEHLSSAACFESILAEVRSRLSSPVHLSAHLSRESVHDKLMVVLRLIRVQRVDSVVQERILQMTSVQQLIFPYRQLWIIDSLMHALQ